MIDNVITSNKVSSPVEPQKAETKAQRCLTALLAGACLNRQTLNEMGIGARNDSVHSLISILRNKLLIPIISQRTKGNVCNYFMAPSEIIRYNDPELRKRQLEDMKIFVEKKRHDKVIRDILKLLLELENVPHAWQYVENLPLKLGDIAEKINALLKKSAN